MKPAFLLKQGRVATYSQLTNQYYFLQGKVVVGKQESHLINYPSLNINHQGKNFPLKLGCYLTYSKVNHHYYYSLTSLAKVANSQDVISYSYLANFSQEIYGATVKLYFLKFYRPNLPFVNWREMKKILDQDVLLLEKKIVIQASKL